MACAPPVLPGTPDRFLLPAGTGTVQARCFGSVALCRGPALAFDDVDLLGEAPAEVQRHGGTGGKLPGLADDRLDGVRAGSAGMLLQRLQTGLALLAHRQVRCMGIDHVAERVPQAFRHDGTGEEALCPADQGMGLVVIVDVNSKLAGFGFACPPLLKPGPGFLSCGKTAFERVGPRLQACAFGLRQRLVIEKRRGPADQRSGRSMVQDVDTRVFRLVFACAPLFEPGPGNSSCVMAGIIRAHPCLQVCAIGIRQRLVIDEHRRLADQRSGRFMVKDVDTRVFRFGCACPPLFEPGPGIPSCVARRHHTRPPVPSGLRDRHPAAPGYR